MYTSKWCCENINSGHFTFKSVLGEVRELFGARNWYEVKEEFGDVMYFTYCWLYSKFRINLPMYGATQSTYKFIVRLFVWMDIFQINGLRFSPRYLINGSNYNRPEKVQLALEIARKEQGK